MPLEIKELTIKVAVSDNGSRDIDVNSTVDLAALKKEIIETCLEQISEKLNHSKER